MAGIRNLGVVAIVVFALSLLPAPSAAQGLRIVVLEGEDRVVEAGDGGSRVLVEVRDRNDEPVSGASVLFLLGEGGTATLNAGLSRVVLTTNALGQAAVTVNPIAAGAVELSVNAAFGGETAMATIVQANIATAAEATTAETTAAGASATSGAGGSSGGGASSGGGLGTGAVVGIVGAAGGAVGVGVAVTGGDSASPAAVPPALPTPVPPAPAPDERAVLVEFYNATNGPNWVVNTNWNSNEILDHWYGVAAIGRVYEMHLPSNQLSGTIPSSLGNLDLDYLHLGNNQLSGTIPSSLGNLANLNVLDLSSNQLSGMIPSALGNLANLEHFSLWGNQLTGSIPAALCKFEPNINPQQNGVYLPCAQSSAAGVPEVSLVPGDKRLEVGWTASSDGGSAIEDYDVRYRRAGRPGAWTELADRTQSAAPGATITGLTNGAAYEVQVRAGGGEWSATATGVPAAAVTPVTFGDARIEDQHWTQYAEAAPLVLPAATGGVGALTYALAPSLPAGLAFDPAARTISGTPSAASAVTYTYTATDAASPPDQASLTFTIEVEASAEEEALRRDALAAQGRALLSSVTGVVGERFRAGRTGTAGRGTERGGLGAAGNALATLLGLPAQMGRAGGAGFGPGGPPAAGFGPGGLSGPGSGAGPPGASGSVPAGVGSAPSAPRPESFGVGAGGRDGLWWGRSFAAPLGGAATADRTSRYTLWGAGDRQSFSGSPVAGRYSGDLRSLYVGADGRLGADWLAGAAVGRSWGTADYAAAAGRGAAGRLTTRLTGVYPYLRSRVPRGPELWAVGGYGRGEAADARGTEAFGEPGALTMAMAAAGLRQAVAERGGVALAVVGGAGFLSLSSADGGRTVAGLAARVHRGRLALEASRASGAVSPFVQLGARWDGGDGQTGGGLEVVTGLRASTARLDLEGRGRWLSAHAAAGYQEYGVTARLAVRPRPDGTGLRAVLAPRWGAAGELSPGGEGLLGGAGAADLRPGAPWTPGTQALALEGEVGYGWRPRRLRGVLSPMTSYRRTGFGGNLTRVGLSWLSSEERLRRNLRLQLTLGREQWRERGAGYQWAVAAASTF